MRVQGKPAALVAITAALTLVVGAHTLATRTSYPQASPQTVDAATVSEPDNTVREMQIIKRASRSRSVAPSHPATHPPTKTTKTSKPLVAPHSRSTQAPKARIVRKEHPSVSRGTSAYAWAHTTDAYKVANCESGDRSSWDHYNGNPHLRDGRYHGKWQMDADFWSTYGGKQFASDAADASESEQDIVAYHGYLARGWQPWSCSRIMGVR